MVIAAGAVGQRLFVIPSRSMVIVRQAELDLEALMTGKAQTPWVDTHFLKLLLDGRADKAGIVTKE